VRREEDVIRTGNGADLFRNEVPQLVAKLRALIESFPERDECSQCLPLELVCLSNHCGFSHRRMLNERRFYFHRPDSMTGDVDHIVYAAEDPEVAIGVALCAVAGEVDVRPSRPL